MVLGKLGKDFAIKLDFFIFERTDKRAVGNSRLPRCGADLRLPEAAEAALLVLASDKGVRPCVQEGLARKALFIFLAPAKSLRVFEKFFALLMGYGSSFDSGHKDILFVIPASAKSGSASGGKAGIQN